MATKRNLYVDQGSTFEIDVDVVLANGSSFPLTNYSARSSFRKHYESNTSFTIDATLDVNTSIMTLTVSSNLSASCNSGRYMYDAEIYNGNIVYRVLEGALIISPEVTKT